MATIFFSYSHKDEVLRNELARSAGLGDWAAARTEKISSGFYTSQAMELCRS